MDGSDVSVQGLLESTFSPTVHAGGHAFAPIPMNALAETLREARDNRGSTTGGSSGSHTFAARNPFSATMPSSLGGSGGKHGRVKSTSNAELGAVSRFAQTLGAIDSAWNRRSSAVETGNDAAGAARETDRCVLGAGDSGDDEDDDEDWDPFRAREPAAAATRTAGGSATVAAEVVPGDHARVVPRTKSRQLLRVGELSGRDPREAAKLMTKEPVFVEISEGGKQEQQKRRHSYRHPLGRRNSERCLLYTSPSPRDRQKSRMPSSA